MPELTLANLQLQLQGLQTSMDNEFKNRQITFNIDYDPSQAPGLAAPEGTFVWNTSTKVRYEKKGPSDTDWSSSLTSLPLTHEQSVASAVWLVNHNLGYWPDVSVFTPGGLEVEAEIVNLSVNSLEIRFASLETGVAKLR